MPRRTFAAFIRSDTFATDSMPRKYVIGLVAASAFFAAALVAFMRGTPDAFPFGDAAVIQIYTLEALRGAVTLGPYSQFGWHHPGPMYFYMLAPLFQLSGWRAIGLVAGALAINLASLATITLLIVRNDGKFAAAILVATLTVFLLRADGLFGSIWNAHIVVVPLAALIVCCAAAAIGDVVALPLTVLLASFVAQTDIALLPCVVGLVITVIASRRTSTDRLALGVAGVIGLFVWLPPLAQQMTGAPGNVTRIWRYLSVGPHPGQSFTTAFSVWADVTTAFVRTHIDVGWGAPYHSHSSTSAQLAAIGQLAALSAVVIKAHQAGQRFIASVCVFGIVASVMAGWSITRMDGELGDYQVLWMSVIGVIPWAVTLRTAVPHAVRRQCGTVLAVSTAIGITVMVSQVLLAARAYAIEQRDADIPRKRAAVDVVDYIERQSLHRPLFHISQETWLDAACVVLHAYKHHPRLAVDQQWITVFGDALSPSGREDAEFYIVGHREHATLSARHDDRLISSHNGLFVHVFVKRFQPTD